MPHPMPRRAVAGGALLASGARQRMRSDSEAMGAFVRRPGIKVE